MSEIGRRIIGQLGRLGNYYNRELSQDALEVFADAVSDLDPETVLEILRQWPASNDWFPKASEVRRAMDGGDDALRQQANAAALEVENYLKTRSKITDTPRIRYAIQVCGGLDSLGKTPADKWHPWVHDRLVEAWLSAPEEENPALPANVRKLLGN